MNLLYCGNEGAFDGLLLSLLSAVQKASCPLHAYVLTMDLTHLNPKFTPLTTAQVDFINDVVQEWGSCHRVERIDATGVFLSEMDGCLNMESGYTPYTLLRLVADKLPLPSPILYLDCDTLFNGDIAALLSYPIGAYELAGVVDHLGQFFIKRDYLNAGVLYLNLARMRKTGLLQRCRALCCTRLLPFPDQDALNALVQKKLVLPAKYNQQNGLRGDTIIQHFSKSIRLFPYFKIVNVKPWELAQVRQELKTTAYDSLFCEYMLRRDAISGVLLPPRSNRPTPPALAQFKSDVQEVLGYAGLNGGIFRRGSGFAFRASK